MSSSQIVDNKSCDDCKNSDHCIECNYCTDCDYCNSCKDCIECNYCIKCKKCDECNHCEESKSCIQCENCIECKNLEFSNDCTGCEDSYHLINCVLCCDCIDCEYCVNSKNLYYSKNINNYDSLEAVEYLIKKLTIDDIILLYNMLDMENENYYISCYSYETYIKNTINKIKLRNEIIDTDIKFLLNSEKVTCYLKSILHYPENLFPKFD